MSFLRLKNPCSMHFITSRWLLSQNSATKIEPSGSSVRSGVRTECMKFIYDRSKIAPSNFSEQVVQLHTQTLLWVSDPHFSADNHDFPQHPAGLAQMN